MGETEVGRKGTQMNAENLSGFTGRAGALVSVEVVQRRSQDPDELL